MPSQLSIFRRPWLLKLTRSKTKAILDKGNLDKIARHKEALGKIIKGIEELKIQSEKEKLQDGTSIEDVQKWGDYGSREGTSDFRLRTSDFGLQTSDFGLQTSDFRLRTSDFGLQTSDFGLQTSDFRLRTSDFGLRTSDFGLQTSDFGLRTSDFGLRTSDFGLQTLDFIQDYFINCCEIILLIKV